MNSRLPIVLNDAHLISTTQKEQLVEWASLNAGSIPERIVDLGWISAQELNSFLGKLFSLTIKELHDYNPSDLCQKIGLRDTIIKHRALPLSLENHCLTIAISDPTVVETENDFRFATGLQTELVLANCQDIRSTIRKLFGDNNLDSSSETKQLTSDDLANLVQVSDAEIDNIEDLSQDDSPVSRFIHQVLMDAVRKKASDIHFEPYEHLYRIRLRCDGILIETHQPATQLSRRLAARIKILAKLDIAERRLPQDGRLKLRLSETASIDMRVSTLPTMWGEKIVLRLLDGDSANLDIDQLGYNELQKSLYLAALKKPQGMILMTGPTGSGKTVSLYTGLNILNTAERNVSTAEDPVEIHLDGINQVQINPKIGFDFSTALRSFLRQDPDVVMLGEIRDIETAEIAVKAAQTGHLVLSTLHTNSAAETVMRLKNMGVESINLASSLSLIIAQRLARKLCQHCKVIDPMLPPLRHSLAISDDELIYQASEQGCNHCNYGYLGRTGIYEVMECTHEIANALLIGASMQEIEALAQSQGMTTLKQSGIEKLRDGVTSYQELQRVLYF
ncbi:type IV-A pilus assembly ATPase PilB [Vibrio wakamikoensis]|uniref:Type IV-A pilus assembly ATPase PilB n=1 Tax=Vibrio chaetopteri TaxID=3016528 RepID=A0AAU8BMD6_9VIBR